MRFIPTCAGMSRESRDSPVSTWRMAAETTEKTPWGGGKHTLDCYTDELICGYIEDEDATASDSDAGHRHVQDCFALDCPHENGKHDGDCGYIEAVEGTPCGNVCELCGGTVDNGSSDNGIKSITLVAFDGLEEAVERQSVPMGTPLEELVLPETLSATAQTEDESPETVTVPGVTWEPDVLYEGAEGSYDFTASAAGYTCAQGVDWPVITVTVEETVPDEIDTLCAAIDALPTVDEISDNAPGNVAPEYDAWVTETRAMLESVPALWEQFLVLSEEDAAAMVRITDERASKLMGLNDLAARLGEAKTLAEPTPTVDGDKIYANGVPLLLVASDIYPEYTVIYIDNGTIGELDDEDVIFDPDGTGPMNDTEFGNSISYHWIYGGGQDADITTRTRITMLGGKVGFLYGGGFKKATGSTTIIVSGGKVLGDIYGGGFGNGGIINGTTDIAFSGDAKTKNIYGGGSYGSVTGTVSIDISGGTVEKSVFGGSFGNGTTGTIDLTVGGAAKIGDGSGNGVIIKDTSTYENGVDSFAIAPALTGENGSVSVYLPGDYAPGTIATGAEAGDLEKIKLVGDGAEGLETYLEEGAIKVKTSGTTTGATGGTIESGTTAENIQGYFGGESAVTVTVTAGKGTIQLQQDVTLNAKVIFNDATRDWTLDLNGHTLAGAQPTGKISDLEKADGITPVTLTGGTLAVVSTGGNGTLRGGDAHESYYTNSNYGGNGGYGLRMTDGELILKDRKVTLRGGDGKIKKARGGYGLDAEKGKVTLSGVTCQGGNSLGTETIFVGVGVSLSNMVTVSEPINCIAQSGTTQGSPTAGLYCQTVATISDGSYTGVSFGAKLASYTGKKIVLTGGTFEATGDGGKAIDASSGSVRLPALLGEGYGYYIGEELQTVGEDATSVGGQNETVTVREAYTLPTADNSNIYANGTPLLLVQGEDNTKTVVYIDKGTIGELDNEDVIFDPDGDGSMVNTEAGNDLSNWSIYGGSMNSDLPADTQITMTGGSIGTIYGGGRATSNQTANVRGDTSIKISDGTVRIVYAGGEAAAGAAADVSGNTTLEITGGKIINEVYGGGRASGNPNNGSSAIVGESSTVSISGNAVLSKDVFGGGYANKDNNTSNVNCSVTGPAIVSISGNAEVKGNVYQSGYLYSFGEDYYYNSDDKNNSATVGANSSITIGGGARIGDNNARMGIIINGGSSTVVQAGTASFAIGDDLTDRANVCVVLPLGYDIAGNPAIAANAVQGDLAKIKLVGYDAKRLEPYFDSATGEIKVRSTPTADTGNKYIYANGAPLLLVEGSDETKTVVYIDRGTIGVLDEGIDVIFDPDGDDTEMNGTEVGNDLSDYGIFGGRMDSTVTGDCTLTMIGGRVNMLCGGNMNGTVTGDTSVTIRGGQTETAAGGGGGFGAQVGGSASVTVTSGTVSLGLYGGGYSYGSVGGDVSISITGGTVLAVYGKSDISTVAGKITAMVGDGASIGNGKNKGLHMNTAAYKNGVDSLVIQSRLTGTPGCISVYLDESFDASDNPAIAAGAVLDDLAKITLVGAGAAGKTAYFENDAIKVKAVPHTHAMSVDCSTSVEDQVNFDKTLTAGATTINASGNYYLAEDVDLGTNRLTVTGTGTVVNLCLNGHTLTAGDGYSSVLQVEKGAELNLCDCQPQAVNNTQITDPTTSQPVTITGGLITGGEEPTEEYSLATIMISGEAPTNRSALRMYGGTVAGNVSNAWTVSVLNGSFELHGGRLAYNTAFSMCIESIDGGHLKISGGAIEHNRLTRQNGNGYAVSHSGDSLTLSGQPVIKDNTTLNGPAAGINLNSNESITIGEGFAPDPTIGVTTATYPTESSPVAITGENDKDYSRFFFSHSDDYVIQNGANNVVQLVKKPPLSGARAITAFTISGQAGDTVIDQTNHTITVTMPNGTDITSLTPTIEVSDKAGVSPASGTAQDFTNSVTYTVTAEDETTQEYFVTVMVQTGGVVIYNASDAAAFKAILDAHPSLKTGIDENDPASWETAGLVTWTGEDSKRITRLYLNDKGLTGTLDVTGLTGLTYLDCGNNRLKTLDATALPVVLCKNNPITLLKRANSEHLTVESAEGGTVELTDYAYDTKSAALTAAAAEGYIFKGWTATGTTLADAGANPVTFALNSIITITPVFERKPDPAPSGTGGSSSGGGSSSPNGSSVSAPSTTTSTTVGENGTSITITQTTSKDSSGKTTTVTTEVTKDAAGNETGRATTVTTDHVAASAAQGSSTVTVKPDAAAINSAAKAAGATAASPMDIAVSVPKDSINSELQKADVSAVHAEVIIPKSVEDNPAVRTAGITVEKETVDAARQTGKNVTVTVREDTGAVKAVWSLDGQAMGNAEGQSTDLKLGVYTAPVQSGDPIAASVKPSVTAAGQENGLVISLTVDGTLLTAAKLTVPATNQTAITAGSTVALYRFDPDTGTLRAVPGGVYSVDADGNVTIDIPAGTRTGAEETYVLLPVQGAVGTGNGTTHTIRKGDTLNQISQQYGCRVEDLLALNPGVDIYNLQVGSDLRIR